APGNFPSGGAVKAVFIWFPVSTVPFEPGLVTSHVAVTIEPVTFTMALFAALAAEAAPKTNAATTLIFNICLFISLISF
ncbi:hypothetical protein LWT70_24075, partial [Enterobacter hormaechei]|nr:hypothetical protein [Enterobacter hormaechei]